LKLRNSLILIGIVLIGLVSSLLINRFNELDKVSVANAQSIELNSDVALPFAADYSICRQTPETMCLSVMTGTMSAVYNISNPNGISGFSDYEIVNFQQRLLSATSTSINVEVITKFDLPTEIPFPIDFNSLPEDIRNSYLQPEPNLIQSDHPDIIAKANEIVTGTTRQAEAVEAIITWVRAHVEYDRAFGTNRDALSVLRDLRSTCTGFSRLTVALLRSVGIPSRVQRGCTAPPWYSAGGGTGASHSWVEVYYEDLGWAVSEPQSTANSIMPGVFVNGFNQCGNENTQITQISFTNETTQTYYLKTLYDNSIRYSVQTATVPSWDRNPLQINPTNPAAILSKNNPVGNLSFRVESLNCYNEGWQVRTDTDWLTSKVIASDEDGIATLLIDASGKSLGTYSASVIVYDTSNYWDWQSLPNPEWYSSRIITVKLYLVENVYTNYLPIISRR